MGNIYKSLLIVITLLIGWSASVWAGGCPGGEFACSINGTTSVLLGNSATFSMNGLCPGGTLGTVNGWSVDCGTITASSSTSVTVLFNFNCSSATINALHGSTVLATKNVSITFPALNGGSINTPVVTTVNNNTMPDEITASGASGGNGTYAFKWQSSIFSSTTGFSDISGATGQNLFPSAITHNTWYRRSVTSGTQTANTSNVIEIDVYPPLVSGTVSPMTQNINNGAIPASLTVTAATGGAGGYSYQWQSSVNGLFTDAINVGTNSTTYLPPALTGSLYYRAVSTSNGGSVNSVPAFVNVYPPIQPGTISPGTQSINHGANGSQLTIGGVSGGNGSYTYLWSSSSTINGTYTSIGVTGTIFTPTALTSTTYYEVTVTSNLASATSPPATVTVYPILISGTVSPASQFINNNTVPLGLTVSSGSGGNGTYSYQWQSCSTPNGTYTAVGSGGATFTPGALTSTTYFEAVTTSNGVSVTSLPVTVNVYPPVQPGVLSSPSGNSLSFGMDVGFLSGTSASGGNGTYSYQWQVSPDNSTWSNAGAGGPSYEPGALFSNTYYRRVATSNGVLATSNVLALTVTAPANAPGSDVQPGGTASPVSMPVYGTLPDAAHMNYVRTRTITKPGITDPTTAAGLTSPYDAHQSTEYFDGLGRSLQTVDKQATPSQADLINTNFYDAFGRVVRQFLPYTDNTSTGIFRSDPATQQPVFYNAYFNNTESYYYNNATYEASPLNRNLQNSPAGKSWTGNGRGASVVYLVNTVDDSVHNWRITYGETDYPTTVVNYAPGTLTISQTTDENGHMIRIYKDIDGQVVLKKVQEAFNPSPAHEGWLSTYYVYDDLNQLRCVIPPKATAQLGANGWGLGTLANLCFQYTYDGRRRMILKKVPDAAPVYMVYNLKDQLVLSQDGNLRGQNQWLVTQYDTLDRPVRTGIFAAGSSFSLDVMQGQVNANQAYPTTGVTLNTVTYYDDYTQVNVPAFTSADVSKLFSYTNSYPDAVVQSSQTRGLATTTQTRVLESLTTQWLTTVHYYDEKGRAIQQIGDNISGSKDTATTSYDFSGKVLSTYARHNNLASHLNPRTTVLQATTYDHMGRATASTEQLNDNGINKTISASAYDALGRLTQMNLGNSMESLNYDYNIRGWLRGVNRNYITGGSTHFFGMELNYDFGFGTAQYNGNIAGMKWKSAGDALPRAYGYGYDALNRLQFADFQQDNSGGGTSFAEDGKVDFDVPQISYDANGNILTMKQNGLKVGGSAPIDQLTYSYSGTSNQLLSVTDAIPADTSSRMGDFQDGNTAGNDYIYDANGNLKIDANKHIDSIRYNYLNLPEYIHIKGKGTISYVYDAGGVKYLKIVTDSTKGGIKDTTTYIDAFVYHSDTLQFMGHEEGRVRYVNKINQVSGQPFQGFVFDYFLKDHLGNTRIVLSEEQDTAIYVATMEQNTATTEDQLFNNVNTTQTVTPGGFEPSSGADTSNHFVSKLNGSSGGNRVGPSIVLKVMARDTVNANVYAWYTGATQPPPSGETPLINDLLITLSGDVLGQSAGHFIGGLTPVTSALGAVLPTFLAVKDADDLPAQPKAFLNWVLFDNQLNYVTGGVTQVPAITAGDSKKPLQASIPVMPKSGYLYIYVSNESQQDVFFDKLDVQHLRGPLLEENHYYPFGLTMAGISDKALKTGYAENKYRYNKGSELQNKEFSDGSGLEMYETHFRELDPQLGRWWQIDPKTEGYEHFSPYASMYDDPTAKTDSLGDEGSTCCQTALGVLQLTDQIQQSIVQAGGGPADPVTDAVAGFVDAAGLIGSSIGLIIDLANSNTSTQQQPATLTGHQMIVRAYQMAHEVNNANVVFAKKGPKDLVGEAIAAKQKAAEAAARTANREAATAAGKVKTGNSNQVVRGDHNTGTKRGDKHGKRIERAQREQKAADAAREAAKKKNN